MKQTHSEIARRVAARLWFVGVLVLLIVSTERPAKAYVDPGSGALVWQGLLAAFVGSAFYLRRIVGWLKNRLSKAKEN